MAEQGQASGGAAGTPIMGAVTTAAPTYVTATFGFLSLDTAGALRVSGSITAIEASVGTTGAAVPASATYLGISIGGTLTGALGGHGTAAGALRVELPTDGTGLVNAQVTSVVPGVGATNLGKTEDVAHSSGDTGVFVLGVANEAQTTLANDGDYIGQATDTKGNHLVIGNLASGSTDAGAPVKVGAKYNSTLPTFTNGQRGDLQIGTRGSLDVTLYAQDSTTAASLGTVSDAQSGLQGLFTHGQNQHWNGATWDRVPGSATGALVQPQAIATGGASFLNIAAGQATTVVKSGAGTLYAIVLNSAATAANTTTIYDNTAASGTVIGRPAVTTATVPTTLTFGPAGLAFATGLTIITATQNGGDMTVIYK